MKYKYLSTLIALCIGVSSGAYLANASSNSKAIFDVEYPGNSITCFVCHTGTPGSLTAYGTQYINNGGFSAGSLAAIQAIDSLDADNDGMSNGAAIAAGIDPNGGSSSGGGTEQASVTGCVTSSLSTPLMLFLSMLILGFFARRNKA